MFKYFRQLRLNLFSESKTGKYLKYALGEIILVVIGILIALQINNWNEYRKEQNMEQQYLLGIKEDLEVDIPFIERRINGLHRKISELHSIDRTYIEGDLVPLDISLDSIPIKRIFNRGPAFRLTTGSYNTLVSNAAVGLIKNAELLQDIQTLYGITHSNIRSIYEDLKTREEYIGWKYAKALSYSNTRSFFIDNPNRAEVLADFAFFYKQQGLMYRRLKFMRGNMLDIIAQLEKELE